MFVVALLIATAHAQTAPKPPLAHAWVQQMRAAGQAAQAARAAKATKAKSPASGESK